MQTTKTRELEREEWTSNKRENRSAIKERKLEKQSWCLTMSTLRLRKLQYWKQILLHTKIFYGGLQRWIRSQIKFDLEE